MKIRILKLFITLCLIANKSFCQSWQEIKIIPYTLLNSFFVDGIFFKDTGTLISGNGIITKTNNFFQSFVNDTSCLGKSFDAISFPNRKIGYISSVNVRGGLLKTTDGGNLWSPLTTGPFSGEQIGEGLVFVTQDTGYSAYLVSDAFITTNNGGVSWATGSISLPNCAAVFRIRVIKDSIIYALCNDNQFSGNFGFLHLVKSVNYGTNWSEIYSFQQTGFGDFYLLDDTTIICATNQFIFKSVNGGFSFDTVLQSNFQSDEFSFHTNAISFIDKDTGFVAFEGAVYKSFDGGKNWLRANFQFNNTDFANRINFISAISSQDIVVACQNGNIYKTTTGGGIWSGINDVAEEKTFTIYPNPTSGKLFGTISSTNTKATIQIITPDGRVVMQSIPIQQTRFEADVSNLATGIYFLVLQDEQERFVKKFIKM